MRFITRAAVFLAFCASAVADRAPDASAAIDRDVESLVQLLGDGVSVGYPEFRSVSFGKILGSEREDAVALFSIEGFHGGNVHFEYLAIFEAVEPAILGAKHSKSYRLAAVSRIGGRGWRTFDFKSVALLRNGVRLTGKKATDSDPSCCPSVPIQVLFRIDRDRIIESATGE